MEHIKIVFRPDEIDYRKFTDCNDLCFKNEPISEEEFQKIRQGDFWAVYDHDKLIGYGVATLTKTIGRIKRVAIRQEYRNTGLGTRLMDLMMSHCQTMGCSKIALSVQQDNPAAIHLYEKLNFQRVKTAYQYLVDLNRLHANDSLSTYHRIRAVPIDRYSHQHELPPRILAWQAAHNPPHTHILLFIQDDQELIGFCRLNPDYPGCSPFEIDKWDVDINSVLSSLVDLVSADKKKFRLTFSDEHLEKECRRSNYILNYTLYEMEYTIR